MSNPLSADRIVSALKAEGVTVVEVGNWRTHNRNHKGAWGPVHGVMIHHTVTSGAARTVAICRDGYAALPGPLCHGVITKDGRVHLVGYGRANHAGSGDPDVLAAVIAEKPLPPDNEATTDGNARFYGFECENLGDGHDPWPAAQLEAIERVSAAICRHHGWSARSVIGHLEWQPGKVDPRGFTMAAIRARIDDRLTGIPSGGQNSEEDDMALTDEQLDQLADLVAVRVWTKDNIRTLARPDDKYPDNSHWTGGTYTRNAFIVIKRIEAAVTEVLARGAARDAVLARLAEGGGLTLPEVEAAAEAGAQAALDRLATALKED